MYNGQFRQHLHVLITSKEHSVTLDVVAIIKKQCDAWYFNVHYTEHKSARKGEVLSRELMIYQTAYAGDILIFKEAIRRICHYFQFYSDTVKVAFTDRGAEPENNIRNEASIPTIVSNE